MAIAKRDGRDASFEDSSKYNLELISLELML